ncbi:MAG: hypothetical protein ACXABY_12515 [Candidatus Thorarchaeota archaeon]|jgi:hypothetical protein
MSSLLFLLRAWFQIISFIVLMYVVFGLVWAVGTALNNEGCPKDYPRVLKYLDGPCKAGHWLFERVRVE